MESEEITKSLVKKGLFRIIRVLLIVYLLMCLGVYLFQAKLVFVPTKGEPAYTPENLGLEYEDLSLKSGQETVHAWFVAAKENKGTVLFCHGNAGNLGHRLSTIRVWNKLGMNIFLFDYRGFGKSTGTPSEEGCYEDVKTCYEWLEKNSKLSSKPFIIHGRSLGGGSATWAAMNFECDGLILESTFTSVPDMGARLYPFLPIRILSKINFPNEERVKSFKKPLLIIHGKEDEVIPYEMGRKMAEQTKADFLELTGAHNSGFDTSPDYGLTLRTFVEKLISLKPSGDTP